MQYSRAGGIWQGICKNQQGCFTDSLKESRTGDIPLLHKLEFYCCPLVLQRLGIGRNISRLSQTLSITFGMHSLPVEVLYPKNVFCIISPTLRVVIMLGSGDQILQSERYRLSSLTKNSLLFL
jgi:hypothetical protein